MDAPNLERCHAVYSAIRNCWIARGSALEAHERLSVITVAAGLRGFAFLHDSEPPSQHMLEELLMGCGLFTRPCCSPFDLEFETADIAATTYEAYRRAEREIRPFRGLGIWAQSELVAECPGMSSLGAALCYPRCCEMMDLRTKQKDHSLFLAAIVEEEGDDAERVGRAMRERREYSKASYDHCREWDDRFVQTRNRFPFALHVACDECLRSGKSATALLSQEYEALALAVSPELHLMLQWGARAVAYRLDQSQPE